METLFLLLAAGSPQALAVMLSHRRAPPKTQRGCPASLECLDRWGLAVDHLGLATQSAGAERLAGCPKVRTLPGHPGRHVGKGFLHH